MKGLEDHGSRATTDKIGEVNAFNLFSSELRPIKHNSLPLEFRNHFFI